LICTQCNANYAFNYSANTSCILCNNASVTVYNSTCYNSTPNCLQYQISNTTAGTVVCTQCYANYAFIYASTNCTLCNNSSQVIQNNICYAIPANCQYQISSTDPSSLICTQCNANYAFNYSANTSCILCNNASVTCYNSTPNCLQYQISNTTAGTLVCTQCNASYAFTYGSSNCILCNNTNQTTLNNNCFDGV
jgi:hypothetical protein